jgi:hypothetical protein
MLIKHNFDETSSYSPAMKLSLPLLLLSTAVALTFGKQTTKDVHLSDWITTDGIDSDTVDQFNMDIGDCVDESHSNWMFGHCIEDHLHYYDKNEFSSQQKSDILRKAKNTKVHGGHGHTLRGI